MRRTACAVALLALLLTGCSRLAQQQDTLAPHVASPNPPAAAAPSPSVRAGTGREAAAPAIAPGAAPCGPASAFVGGQAEPPGPGCATADARSSPNPAPAAAGEADVSAARPETAPCAPAAVTGGQAQASGPGCASPEASVGRGSASAAASRPSAAEVVPSGAAPAAQATSSARPSPPASAPVVVAPTGSRALLEPIQHEYETWNNCAPVTSEMVLSYYGILKRQTEIAPVLRPHPKNFSVRMDQISAYLGQFGLDSQPLIGGTLAQLKALVSNGIPVVVEDQLSLQEDYGHFRVVRGFDDAAGVIIFGDSYYGPMNRLSYGLYQELWKRHNYAFMPVYKPAQRALVQAILPNDLNPANNREHALNDARQAAASRPDDGFAWLNFGDDLYRAGQLQEARAAWERAKQLQLTGRTLWYTIWPAAVYNQLGDYQRALEVVAIPLASDPDNAEALLERGNAYAGLGNKDRARADYAHAAEVDPSLVPARQALDKL